MDEITDSELIEMEKELCSYPINTLNAMEFEVLLAIRKELQVRKDRGIYEAAVAKAFPE